MTVILITKVQMCFIDIGIEQITLSPFELPMALLIAENRNFYRM